MTLNPLLLASAALFAAAGLALTFAPAESIEALGGTAGHVETWIAQLAGAGFLSVAWLDWMQRFAILGGVLGRPIVGTNLLLSVAGTGASLSAWRDSGLTAPLVAAIVLGVLAVAFGILLFRPPRPANP